METMTITIKGTPKGKQLVGYINELAKAGEVEIKKSKTYKDVEKSLREVKEGKVEPFDNLFK